MKPSELHGMSDDVLALTLADTEKAIFNLRFQASTDKLNTPSEITKAKKDIARIRHEQRRRQIEKLNKLSDSELAAAIDSENSKTEGPGKRRAMRAVQRLAAVQASRPKTSGKGK
ncbi:MAG: 50S ribosomal protein L29 [Fimbriiglobus sp.]